MTNDDDDKTRFQPAKKKSKMQYEVGDVLSDIYRITRFIDRGGMGEVYEAVNVHHAEERVAVKVMLPEFASDERVTEMFAKEAGTLTRLHHEAIVPYRLASRDQKGRPYLVTAYVDGPSLEDRFKDFKPTDAEFIGLARQLAEGLGKAHTLGAIHRDIAPDNILLVGGNPNLPKIIDFGIAKDAREDGGGATIIGDGFAGKLKYVAPEQLGEYERSIGPWTDLYSLALTLLAVASQKHADMGGSIVDAVKKRFVVPDISAIPEPFRHAFEAALQPNPKDRPQTMAAFIKLLDSEPSAATAVESGFAPLPSDASSSETTQSVDKKVPKPPKAHNKKGVVFGGIGAVVLAGIVVAYLAMPKSADLPPTNPVAVIPAGEEDATEPKDSVITPPAQIEPTPSEPPLPRAELTSLGQGAQNADDCSWLQLDSVGRNSLRYVGGAGDLRRTHQIMSSSIKEKTTTSIELDLKPVVQFTPALCDTVMAIKSIRNTQPIISSPDNSRVLEARNQVIRFGNGNEVEGKFVTPNLSVSGIDVDKPTILMSINSLGEVYPLANGRDEIRSFVELMSGTMSETGFSVAIPTQLNVPTGEGYGFIIITGDAPFPKTMFGDASKEELIPITEDWGQKFQRAAKVIGWKSDAYWYTVVDENPD